MKARPPDQYTGTGFSEAKAPLRSRFQELLAEIDALHTKKQADYGADNDPFANVRASTEWGVPAWVGALIRATDKVRRLQTYAKRGTLANEGVEDSFKDLAVYALIGLVLWEEENHKSACVSCGNYFFPGSVHVCGGKSPRPNFDRPAGCWCTFSHGDFPECKAPYDDVPRQGWSQ